MTAQESQYTDGEWYWVEIESWGVKKSAPAMYKADCEAFYSFEFSGIPTRQVEVLEPCRRAPQTDDAQDQRALSVIYPDGYDNPFARIVFREVWNASIRAHGITQESKQGEQAND